MSMITITSTNNILTVSLWDIGKAAWNAFVNHQDMSSVLTAFINPVIINAENSQPEWTEMELTISKLVNPVTGTDYSSRVASWVNEQWRSGKVVGANREPIIPWPEYLRQIAWGSKGKVVLRWVKGAVQIIILIGLVVAGLWALGYVLSLFGVHLPGAVEKREEYGKPLSWWDKLSFGEKGLVVSGITVTALFGIWFLAQKSIAEAGAGKQTIIIGG